MIYMTLKEIAEVCAPAHTFSSLEEERTVAVGGVTDNRKVEPGNLFFAIKGERVDGHRFAQQAIDAGASAVIAERPLPEVSGPVIVVESTTQALSQIAAAYRARFSIPVIGITGSVGKTSTKEMIASILSEKYNVLKTDGNFNNEIGMPLTLLRVREAHEVAVVEMGINHFGEMDRMSRVARPDLFVMTNIGECHLEFLGDRDGVLKAKTEGFAHMKPGTCVVLNADDDKLFTLREDPRIRPVFYHVMEQDEVCGTCCADLTNFYMEEALRAAAPSVFADEIAQRGEDGTDFTLHARGCARRVHLSVPGIHMVRNALAGTAAALELGLTMDEIVRGIEAMQTISGRSHFIHAKNGVTIIDDCYNANPTSTKASLDMLAGCSGRRIAVLGDMGELGTDEVRLHREVGAYAASLGLDALFFCGPLFGAGAEEMPQCPVNAPRQAGEVCAGEMSGVPAAPTVIRWFAGKEEMIPEVTSYLRPGDTVLVKASHFMGFDQIVESLQR